MNAGITNDIVIAGGGPVGATLALALQNAGYASTMIEPRALTSPDAPDGRALALSHGSRLILERLGVWKRVPAFTPITTIHVSQRGGFGFAKLTAQEMQMPALGYIVGHAPLMRALEAQLDEAGIEVLRGYALKDAQPQENTLRLDLENHEPLYTKLLAVADGGANAGLAETKTREYKQVALTCEVATIEPHRNRAFERFTPEGPLALLPQSRDARGWSLVWIAPLTRIETLLALDAAAFAHELQNTFGKSLGAFALLNERRTFPLVLNYATDTRTPRTVLVGAASQTLHPIAGQGLNLGLRDAWEFAQLLVRTQPTDVGAESVLAQHQRQRRRDRFATVAFTDILVRIFCNDMPALRAMRGLGLTLFGGFAPAKHYLMRRMMFGARG